jgi:Kdo2-lipid IVA lauroyltransferase/acyltransferase
MTAPALAVLALRFDCDVLSLRVERLDGARFRVTVFPPLPLPRSGDRHADAAALMARVNATLEAWIRDRPEQWLWVHRRWPD